MSLNLFPVVSGISAMFRSFMIFCLHGLLLSVLLTGIIQANDNIGPQPTSPSDCGSNNGNNGFYCYFGIGQTNYTKTDLLNLARRPVSEGYYLGQNPSSFDSFFNVIYTQDLTSNLAVLNLTVETTILNEKVLLPATLKMKRATSAEVIEQNGAIRQVLTTNTLAEVVPLAYGYHVKVYDRNVKGAKDSTGLYMIPVSSVPLSEWIMRTPDGGAFQNTVESVIIDRKNSGGVRVEIRHFVRETATSVYSKLTYAGSLDTSNQVTRGGLLETDIVSYQDRGAKPYDYTVIRTISRVTTTASGPQYGSLKQVSCRLEQYKDFTPSPEGGQSSYKRRIREVDGFNTDGAREILYVWYDEPSNLMIHGRLQSMTKTGGYWEYYTYTDSAGAAAFQQTKYSAWRDASFGSDATGASADLENARKEVTSVGSTTGFTKTISYGNSVTEKQSFSTIPQSDGSILNTLTQKDGADHPVSVRVWSLNSPTAAVHLAGRIAWMENPDGTAETYAYTATAGGGFRLVHRKGAGDRHGVTAGSETTTEYNSFVEASAETVKDIQTGLEVSSWLAPEIDVMGRPKRIEYNGVSTDYETFQYSCCGLERRVDRQGGITTWSRDPLKRVYLQSYYRTVSDTTPMVTGYTYDGLITTEWRGGFLIREVITGMNGEVVSTGKPDENGDGLPERTDQFISYSTNGGKKMEISRPDGGTESHTFYLDGQIKSSVGSLAPYVNYTYGVETTGAHCLWRKVNKLASAGGGSSLEIVYSDLLGRFAKIEHPNEIGSDGSSAVITYAYHGATAPAGSIGQLFSITASNGDVTSYEYSPLGQRSKITELTVGGGTHMTQIIHDVVQDATLGVSYRISTTVDGGQSNVVLTAGDEGAKRRDSAGQTATVVRTPYTYLLQLRCDENPAGWRPGILTEGRQSLENSRQSTQRRE